MEIVVKPDTFAVKKNDNVYGVIFLKFEEVNFPEVDWTDFVVVLLSSWIYQVLSLINSDKQKVILRFMDGAYLIELEKTVQKNDWHLTLREEHGENIRYRKVISSNELRRQLLESSSVTLQYANISKLNSSDIEALSIGYEQLANLDD